MPWIADLWSHYFSFVPLWRRDDVMISYSAAGGGIGAHIDNYDVFLIQGRCLPIARVVHDVRDADLYFYMQR